MPGVPVIYQQVPVAALVFLDYQIQLAVNTNKTDRFAPFAAENRVYGP